MLSQFLDPFTVIESRRQKMRNQAGSSRMDTVLKMMLIAFISLLAFSSGVYFGKQLSDSDYQLKALEGDFSKSSTKTAKKDAHGTSSAGANPEDAINEEEVAAMSEKFVANEHGDAHESADHEEEAHAAPAAHGETRKVASTNEHDEHAAAPSHAAPAAKTAANAHGAPAAGSKPDLSAVHKAAARVANNAAPEATHGGGQVAAASHDAPTRVPSSLPKTVGATADVEFTVQVASYPTMDAAKAKSEELKQKGFVAFPVEANVNGKTWYRVSVGSFKTYKDATTYRAQFLKATNLTTAIVQKIQR
jgi:cell division septation protein DedD